MFFFLLLFLLIIILTRFSNSKKPTTSSIHNNSHDPPSYPFIGCLFSFYKNRRRLLDWYTDLLSHSPSQTIIINRLGGRRTVVTANPTNVEYVLKTNFHNFPKGKPFTEILGDLLGCGIFNVDGESWTTQRKLASHEFTTKSLRDFVVKTLQGEVENRLIPLLDEAAENGDVLDLQDVLRRFSFDIICKVSLGTDPCCLDLSRPVPPLVKAFDTASEISAMRGMAPVFLVWKVKRALNIGSEKKLKAAVKVVRDCVSDIIRNKLKRKANFEENNDLLARLLLAEHDEEVIRDMVISFIMAGRDTTSAAMTWLFWLLSEHEGVERMVTREVASVLDGGDKELDYEGLKEMTFIKACLCESMRLYPPVAWDSKHAVADDVLPDGTRVRAGDRVTYFPYGMGRMEELWGEDRLEFKPDRWLAGEGAAIKAVSPYKFPVFQAGPRVCLGKEMAFLQMTYVVASVMNHQFVIKPVCEDRPAFVPLLTAHMAGGFRVLIQKRPNH